MLDKKGAVKVPTILGPKYTTDWRGKPPHMLAPDIPVWYRFLDKWKEKFLTLYYDSLLGAPELSAEEENDSMKVMWRALTSKRSDVIAVLKDEIWIIEVTDYAGMRTLGQLLTYHTLWVQNPPIDKPEKLILVATAVDPNLVSPFLEYNVETHLV